MRLLSLLRSISLIWIILPALAIGDSGFPLPPLESGPLIASTGWKLAASLISQCIAG